MRRPRRRGAPHLPIARPAARSRRQGALLSFPNELVEIALEAFARLCRPGVERNVGIVDRIQVEEPQRPGAARRACRASDVRRGNYARGWRVSCTVEA